jgi:hypothetical protein
VTHRPRRVFVRLNRSGIYVTDGVAEQRPPNSDEHVASRVQRVPPPVCGTGRAPAAPRAPAPPSTPRLRPASRASCHSGGSGVRASPRGTPRTRSAGLVADGGPRARVAEHERELERRRHQRRRGRGSQHGGREAVHHVEHQPT